MVKICNLLFRRRTPSPVERMFSIGRKLSSGNISILLSPRSIVVLAWTPGIQNKNSMQLPEIVNSFWLCPWLVKPFFIRHEDKSFIIIKSTVVRGDGASGPWPKRIYLYSSMSRLGFIFHRRKSAKSFHSLLHFHLTLKLRFLILFASLHCLF